MHPHEALLRRFFEHLARRDAEAAIACCDASLFHSDPLHPRLRGADAADLWRMRLAPGSALEVTLVWAQADADGGRARWVLRDAVGAHGRPVEVEVASMFGFRQGLITRQYDHFSFWRWASQALGPAGAAFGWLGPVKWAVRRRHARALERFQMSLPAAED